MIRLGGMKITDPARFEVVVDFGDGSQCDRHFITNCSTYDQLLAQLSDEEQNWVAEEEFCGASCILVKQEVEEDGHVWVDLFNVNLKYVDYTEKVVSIEEMTFIFRGLYQDYLKHKDD